MNVGYEEVHSIRPRTKKLDQVDGASETSIATAVTGLWATGNDGGIGHKWGDTFRANGYFHLVLVEE